MIVKMKMHNTDNSSLMKYSEEIICLQFCILVISLLCFEHNIKWT